MKICSHVPAIIDDRHNTYATQGIGHTLQGVVETTGTVIMYPDSFIWGEGVVRVFQILQVAIRKITKRTLNSCFAVYAYISYLSTMLEDLLAQDIKSDLFHPICALYFASSENKQTNKIKKPEWQQEMVQKVFQILAPIICLGWIRLHPGQG